MERIPSGVPFDVVIVCNGGDIAPLELPQRYSEMRVRVINRENTGWNLGAWEAGWRAVEGYEYFLFLQAECFIKSSDWLFRFEHRMDLDTGLGLLGERLMWGGMTWQYAKENTALSFAQNHEIIGSFDLYQENLRKNGIEKGLLGEHLVSIILFTSNRVLERINGFLPLGDTYIEAVSCEIGLTKKVESIGLRVSQIGDDAFSLIGHSQWTTLDRFKVSVLDNTQRLYRKIFPRR